MGINTIIGVLMRQLVKGGLTPKMFDMWYAAAPMVCFFGPVGAYVMSVAQVGRVRMLMFSAIIFQLYWVTSLITSTSRFLVFVASVVLVVWTSICVVIGVGGVIRSSSAQEDG